MTDIAPLGFDIDTRPLGQAKVEAEKTAAALGKVGDAADRVGRQSKQTGEHIRSVAGQTGGFTRTLGGLQSGLLSTTNRVSEMAAAFGIAQGSGAGVSLAVGLRTASAGISALSSNLGRFGPIAGAAASTVVALGSAYLGAAAALGTLQDRFAQYEARLKNALGSQESARTAMDQLTKSSIQAGISVESTIDAFARLARNKDAIGATRDELIKMTETIQRLGIISGASQGEVAGGLLQLSQALASGRLNGDELRSIMENMPALARAIADGLGISVGQMRALGAAGQLTSEKIFRAILSQAEKVNEEFASMPNTMERSFQRMTDSAKVFGATLGEIIEASETIQAIVDFIARGMESLTEGIRPRTLEELIEKQQEIIRVAQGGQPEVRDAADFVIQYSPAGILAQEAARKNASDVVMKAQEEITRLTRLLDLQRLGSVYTASEEQDAVRRSAVSSGINVLRDINDRVEKLKGIEEKTKSVERAIEALNARQRYGIIGSKDYTEQLNDLQLALRLLNIEARNAGTSIEKLRAANDDFASGVERSRRAADTGIYNEIQTLARQVEKETGSFPGLAPIEREILRQRAGKAADQVLGLNEQTEATRRLAEAVRLSIEAEEEAALQNQVLEFQFKNFGSFLNDDVIAAVETYERALRASTAAQKELAAAQTIKGLDRSIERELYLLDTVGNPARRREFELSDRIREATQGMAPDQAFATATRMRTEAGLQQTRTLKEQSQEMRQQLEMAQRQLKIVDVVSTEQSVQSALLAKEMELRRLGVDLTSQEAQEQIRLTEQIARANEKLTERQREAAELRRIYEVAAEGIQEALSDAFNQAFETGRISGQRTLEIIGNLARKVASEIMAAVVFNPLKQATMSFGDKLVSSILPSLFGGSPAAGPSGYFAGGFGNTGGIPLPSANGNVFLGGNVVPFRNGAIVTHPTLFPMANGGTGLMGEAGEEGILPLRRGPTGRLGVEASGMGGSGKGVEVIVIDQRSSAGAAPVEIQQSRSVDGRQQVRMVIRDELRRGFANGDYDQALDTHFGIRRTTTRR